MMNRLFERFRVFLKIIKTYRDPHVYFLNRLGLWRSPFLALELRNGLKYKIHSRNVARGDYYVINESWVHEIHKISQKYIKEHSVVLDIGAHIGAFSIFAASQADNIKVFAFEPVKENADLLKENIVLNHFENKITPIQSALCSTAGERKIYLSYRASGQNTFFSSLLEQSKNAYPYKTVREIKCVTIKDFFDENKIGRVDFVKMDCEGAEYEILYSTPQEYLDRIKCLSIETHRLQDEGAGDRGYDPVELKKYLKESDFRVSEKVPGVIWAEHNSV